MVRKEGDPREINKTKVYCNINVDIILSCVSFTANKGQAMAKDEKTNYNKMKGNDEEKICQ